VPTDHIQISLDSLADGLADQRPLVAVYGLKTVGAKWMTLGFATSEKFCFTICIQTSKKVIGVELISLLSLVTEIELNRAYRLLKSFQNVNCIEMKQKPQTLVVSDWEPANANWNELENAR
jgi:hypothetical protein